MSRGERGRRGGRLDSTPIQDARPARVGLRPGRRAPVWGAGARSRRRGERGVPPLPGARGEVDGSPRDPGLAPDRRKARGPRALPPPGVSPRDPLGREPLESHHGGRGPLPRRALPREGGAACAARPCSQAASDPAAAILRLHARRSVDGAARGPARRSSVGDLPAAGLSSIGASRGDAASRGGLAPAGRLGSPLAEARRAVRPRAAHRAVERGEETGGRRQRPSAPSFF